ncbi:integration host factor subunit alpha [Thioalkalivibrio sp. HK1]|uniref:integration host factor subunit alpha n=1 Tax=Thioalkalivibrio sp. HK1 TaxID=1469245 RepID=UPI0004720C3D|nr:integration host factor subunit alpha [Thioalkalivibrio sp. HK1]
MKLTKAGMAENLYEEIGLSKTESRDLVGLFFDTIGDRLESGEQVKISGFGNFDLRWKKERSGRNPKTGEEHRISARRVVTFHPSDKLRDKLKAGDMDADANADADDDSQADTPF